MSYTKQTWQTGDVVTAEKLNNVENGIEGAMPLIVTFTPVDGILICDKTLEEIYQAFSNGRIVIGKKTEGGIGPYIFSLISCAQTQEYGIFAEFFGVRYKSREYEGEYDGHYFELIQYSEDEITTISTPTNL